MKHILIEDDGPGTFILDIDCEKDSEEFLRETLEYFHELVYQLNFSFYVFEERKHAEECQKLWKEYIKTKNYDLEEKHFEITQKHGIKIKFK